MYNTILVAVENGPADVPLLAHVTALAQRLGSTLLLLHVADGYAARYFQQLNLSESEEMHEDKDYLNRISSEIRGKGLEVRTQLALGNPPKEILRVARETSCDIIAMGSHGHRLLGDIFHGSTVYAVRHGSNVPVLVIPSKPRSTPA